MSDMDVLADAMVEMSTSEHKKLIDFKFGTVTEVSTKTLNVLIDGSTQSNKVKRACSPKVGDRVLITAVGRIWLATAVIFS